MYHSSSVTVSLEYPSEVYPTPSSQDQGLIFRYRKCIRIHCGLRGVNIPYSNKLHPGNDSWLSTALIVYHQVKNIALMPYANESENTSSTLPSIRAGNTDRITMVVLSFERRNGGAWEEWRGLRGMAGLESDVAEPWKLGAIIDGIRNRSLHRMFETNWLFPE